MKASTKAKSKIRIFLTSWFTISKYAPHRSGVRENNPRNCLKTIAIFLDKSNAPPRLIQIKCFSPSTE